MIQHTLPEVHLLNSSGLLKSLLKLPLLDAIESEQVRYWVFLSYHKANRFQPDHIMDAKWKGLNQYREAKNLSLGPVLALKRLAYEYFEKHHECRVKLDRFSYWQTMMARVSSLPLQAVHFTGGNSLSGNHVPEYRWPAYPYHPHVEDYIHREQLHETHQHLNGSSTAESCWLKALEHPKQTCNTFHKEYYNPKGSGKLQQLCAQIDPELTPVSLLERLELAACLRQILGRFVCDQPLASHRQHGDPKKTEDWYAEACTPTDLRDAFLQEGWLYVAWPTTQPFSREAEFNLMWELLGRLQKSGHKDSPYERLLWIYLLIQNQYLTLLVQRDDFYGFDQFQKYTLTELRNLPEKSYQERFGQAHGYERRSQTGYLEGRFAPKPTAQKMEALLTAVLGGYCHYLDPDAKEGQALSRVLETLETLIDKDKSQLTLVAHFIKQLPSKADNFPYESLYKDTTNKSAILLSLLKYQPLLAKWLTGIDAAANEMDTPPEIFAPLFRVMKAQGIRHATFHVGEDFPHLISGIRAIDDALRFLPLANGDRLGHCTAIGITPAIWRRLLPPTVELNQEARLLDLIFIWRELSSVPEMLHWANKAASEAVRIARIIFKSKEVLSIELLDELFSLRDLYPLYEPLLDDAAWGLRPASIWDDEYTRIENLLSQQKQKPVIKLYREWLLNDTVRQERFKTCEVKTNDLPDEAVVILQQTVMEKMVKQNIAIECPPTSNTRISQYYEVHEHHVFRWMGLPGASISGDQPVAVCLASDDPGIFVTDLKSEFYHLFSVLMHHFGLSAHEALEHVARLNENGRRYRFHSPSH